MKLPYEREYYFWKKNYNALCTNIRFLPRRFGKSFEIKQLILQYSVLLSKLREAYMSDPVYKQVSELLTSQSM